MDSTRIDAMLKDLDLTSSLSDQARSELASACATRELEAGRRLRPQDASDRYLFLLDGQLVRVRGGTPARITASITVSDGPEQLFDHTIGQQDFVITETPCQLLEIPTAALEQAHSTSLAVSDTDLDDIEGAFFSELYDLITSQQLQLPTMPEIALQIQELSNDPNADLDSLTELIQRDGTIAAAMLHATNSPLFRASKPIQSVREAVTRLGFRNTRMLAMNMALRQAFKARHASTREAMKQCWKFGALQSVYSYLIADSLKQLDRERALLAGLIAGIGAVPIIQFVELRDIQPDTEDIWSLVHHLRNLVGVLVINYWDLGSDLVTVAEHAGDWDYRASAPDYASITLIAEWLVRHEESEAVPDASAVPAFEVLGITPPEAGEPMAWLEERADDLAELRAMFNV
ncbi:HDOD domain-containing protein [Thioalkalivibrio sp. ALJT]|uniref:HDOD domain-containing protein n=1 Tax=Thioalkalivibrio sp. ALJT TaxID=1158146 RepID=UPI000380A491|nr:HDOD domain-containing protein [Thioalkalivibrio sp. ALJT]